MRVVDLVSNKPLFPLCLDLHKGCVGPDLFACFSGVGIVQGFGVESVTTGLCPHPPGEPTERTNRTPDTLVSIIYCIITKNCAYMYVYNNDLTGMKHIVDVDFNQVQI